MQSDYLIIGAGIIGLTIARHLQHRYPHRSILIIDKEVDVAQHASGRNSGVLHAGLYYANDSLRAKYCKLGAVKIKQYCEKKNIPLNICGKVIVAKNENEIDDLKQLYQRAVINGVNAQLIDEAALSIIEPAAKTTQHAIYSPETASFHAEAICLHLKDDLQNFGVKFQFNTQFQSRVDANTAQTNHGLIHYNTLINCAGAYADKIAKCYGFIENYTLIPFKGIFLYVENLAGNPLKHIYPLPDKKLKLLGAHFSPEHNGRIKIGPTAVPCLSRENYSWLSNLHFNEMKEVLTAELHLLINNTFNFRELAMTEIKKQTKSGLMYHAASLVKDIRLFRCTSWGKPGILPRLYDIKKQEIVDDFIIQADTNSVHIINSVSPAFTASFAFSEDIVNTYLADKHV
ncbi:MAG: FAD-dependent oxidoreductase [Pseudomonadota bacterium]